MRMVMDYGRARLELDVADAHLIAPRLTAPAPLTDPGAAIAAALESPFDYPPLRRALTPDDRVAVVIDEALPDLALLLTPLLHHLEGAGVGPGSVTLICAPSASRQPWLDDLPDEFGDVHLEIHDPADRKKLSYLATTRHGHRLYLNRTLVDADQVVVLAGRRYLPGGHSIGSDAAVYPALGDTETRAAAATPDVEETGWLLGTPFRVEVLPAAHDGVAEVLGGAQGVPAAGRRRLEALWRRTVPQPADVVVASLSGDPERQTFADLAAAAASAARVVRPGGRIILLSEARPDLGRGGDVLRQADEADEAAERLRQLPPEERAAATLWAGAAAHARIALLSDLDGDVVEELFATPLTEAAQVQRLLSGASCLLLDDAHRTWTVVE
jgi:nickel-dependent lactate racemase